MEVVIERDGAEQREKRVKYWPRTLEEAECLQYVKIEE
jgi:hypothetical protein